MTVRAALLTLLALALLPGLASAEDPVPRPLCDGEPVVDLRTCYHGHTLHVCGSDDRLHGAGCFVPG